MHFWCSENWFSESFRARMFVFSGACLFFRVRVCFLGARRLIGPTPFWAQGGQTHFRHRTGRGFSLLALLIPKKTPTHTSNAILKCNPFHEYGSRPMVPIRLPRGLPTYHIAMPGRSNFPKTEMLILQNVLGGGWSMQRAHS